MGTTLPPGFEALEPFVADWALPGSLARMEKRRTSSIEDIRAFYDAICRWPGARSIICEVSSWANCRLPKSACSSSRCRSPKSARRSNGSAIRMVYDGFDARKIKYTRLIPDNAAQA